MKATVGPTKGPTNCWRVLLAACLALALLGAGVLEAQPRKKRRWKKKPPATSSKATPDTPRQGGKASSTETQTRSSRPAPDPALAPVWRELRAWDTVGARAELDRVLDRDRTEHLVALARVLAQEQRWDEAEKTLAEASKRAPDDARPWLALGEIRLEAQRDQQAASAFERAHQLARARVDAGERSASALTDLGLAEQRTRRFDRAIGTLDAALEAAPGDAWLLYQSGATLAFAERFQDAVARLTRAIDRDPGIAYAYYYRGLSAGRIGRKDLMIDDLNRFLAMAPNAPDAARARQLVRSAGH